MVGQERDRGQQSFLYQDLQSQLNPKRPMYQLALTLKKSLKLRNPLPRAS